MDRLMESKQNNLNKYFSNLIDLGLSQELPQHQIDKGRDFLINILQEHSDKTGIKGSEELVQRADELSKLAIVVQAFAFNCLKMVPPADAPINVADKVNFKYREARLMSLDEYRESKKFYDKTFKSLNKLDALISARKRFLTDPLKSVSVTLNLHNPIEENGVDPKIEVNETVKLPSVLHDEFLKSLDTLLEKYVGRTDMYRDLIARKDFDRRLVIEVIKESSRSYMREHIFNSETKEIFPSKKEALIIAFVLVTAGILPGAKEYYKSPVGHGLTTNTNARPYISYLHEEITHNTLPETKYETPTIPANPNFYWGDTWLDFIQELS